MTAVERAKRFLKDKSRAIAMTAIPLSALVAISAPAKADIVFNTGGCQVSATNGTLSGGSACTLNGLPASNGITGLKLSGSGTVTAPNSGAGITLFFGNSGGTASGAFTGNIPIDFAFSATDSNNNLIDWTLEFLFNGPSSGSFSVNSSTLGFNPISGSGTVSGSGLISAVNAVANSSWFLQLMVNVDNPGTNVANGETLSVTVPTGSIDINGQSAVPEPSTWSMIATAAAGLLFWRRRNKS